MEFDEEILNDFLVEAGEILDRLSEELVEIERKPADSELLNSIFRGFHTIKGGAGFLQLDPLVDICHLTENLFDRLRNHECSLSAGMMDAVLQVVDVLHVQFQQLRQGESPEPASQSVIDELSGWLDQVQAPVDESEAPEVSAPSSSQPSSLSPAAAPEDEPATSTDDEFADLLAALDGASHSAKSVASDLSHSADAPEAASHIDDISEDEFEALLDQLHGVGQGPGHTATPEEVSGVPSSGAKSLGVTTESPSTTSDISPDEMSDHEFESLLDQLHGAGKAPQGEGVSGHSGAAIPMQSDSGDISQAPEKIDSDTPSDAISEDEFESLLDQLHGVGKKPSGSSEPAVDASQHAPAKTTPAVSPSVQATSTPAKVAAPHSAAKMPTAADQEKTSTTTKAETSVRVDTQRLDDIMNLVGELVLVRNRLVRLGGDQQDAELGKSVASLDVVTADLQAAVMKTRMQPIKKVFGRFPRVVRDLARQLEKEVVLDMRGEETDLDKNLVEALADPLIHLVRNSIDHGIELPHEREAAGKPRVGRVELAAQQEGDHILLTIRDDGRGMDAEKIKALAIEKGVLEQDAAERLSERDAWGLIFAPGFSTKQEITNISGRGVGMDVVKTTISQLNGSIEIDSQWGVGTLLSIKVPLTLAIMPTLMVRLAEQTFALPLVNVDEIFDMDLSKRHCIDGQDCITIREQAIPLFYLRRWLVNHAVSSDIPEQGHVVVVSIGTHRVGFVVDQLIGQEEVVIKPLGSMLQGTPGMAGATITGDGRIALILDVPGLLSHYARSYS